MTTTSDDALPSPTVPDEARGGEGDSDSLWDQVDFRRYMLSGFGSLAGSAVSSVAIPTLAAVQLGASSGQIALLVFLGQLPAFVIALPAGALADRHRKRPLMITGDLVCAASVAVIPFSAATGRLHMGTLYAVALLVGAARIVHDAATISYLPALVKPQLLHRANARLSGMFAVADGAGSNAGAALVGALGAARAVTADAASYLVSAWWTWRIRAPEQVQSAGPRRRLAADVWKGLTYAATHRVIRSVITAVSVASFAAAVTSTYWPYYLLVPA